MAGCRLKCNLILPQDNVENFTKRIQDIVRQRLEGDQKLQQLAPEAMQRELTQEVDRYAPTLVSFYYVF